MKSTEEMTDKFEAVIKKEIRATRLGINNLTAIKEAAKKCNTLHQREMKKAVEQAIKEERNRVANESKTSFYIR